MLPPGVATEDEFEPFFGTPHGLDLEVIARCVGGGAAPSTAPKS